MKMKFKFSVLLALMLVFSMFATTGAVFANTTQPTSTSSQSLTYVTEYTPWQVMDYKEFERVDYDAIITISDRNGDGANDTLHEKGIERLREETQSRLVITRIAETGEIINQYEETRTIVVRVGYYTQQYWEYGQIIFKNYREQTKVLYRFYDEKILQAYDMNKDGKIDRLMEKTTYEVREVTTLRDVYAVENGVERFLRTEIASKSQITSIVNKSRYVIYG